MKGSYTYWEVIILKNSLISTIKRLERYPIINVEIKNTLRNLKPYVKEYDNVLSSMSVTDCIEDREIVIGFNKTSQCIGNINNVLNNTHLL
nr:hypothetical protein Z952_p0061 [Clostridium botulinum C/D str. BKT75002]KEI05215.1 hypothetical protein Z954_0061 [Clostridium botulinum C/D str. BKT2873]